MGVIVAWFQEINRICKEFNASYDEVVRIIETTGTEGDRGTGHDRPIVFPGYIGGHCVTPNIEKINKAYPSLLMEAVLKSNEQRKKELEGEQ